MISEIVNDPQITAFKSQFLAEADYQLNVSKAYGEAFRAPGQKDNGSIVATMVSILSKEAAKCAIKLADRQARKPARNGIGRMLRAIWGFFRPQSNLTGMKNVAWPTIDPATDQITSISGEPVEPPQGVPFFASSHPEFSLQLDEDGAPVLCASIDDTIATMPLGLVGYPAQDFEPFIGPRPPRRKPK